MKDNLKQVFMEMPNMDDNAKAQWIELLELPDVQFDAVYPQVEPQLIEVLKGTRFQEDMLTNLSTIPTGLIEEERKVVKDFIDEINSDTSLSDNKKRMLGIIFNSTLELYEHLALTHRTQIEVEIVKLTEDAIIPEYAHPTDAGADICANETVEIVAGDTVIVKTGIAVAIPAGYEIQVRPRSGLSAKTKLRIANAPGTIDSDYRGEIGVIITNTGGTTHKIEKGTKIAQLVISPVPMIKWKEVPTVDDLGKTERGAGGFGSTDSAQAE